MSQLSDVIRTTEETKMTSGNTSASWWSPIDRFYFTLSVIVIGAVGTAGNLLILYAMVASKQYKKYLLILNQNVLDLYTCAFLVVTYSLRHSQSHLNGSLSYWHCTLIVTDLLVKFGAFGSVINLVLVTVERYLKICTKKKLRRWMILSAMAFTWIASVVYNVAAVFSTTAFVDGKCLLYAIFAGKFAKSFYLTFNFLSFYVLILFTFVFCYGRILTVVRRQTRVMSSHSAAQSSSAQTQSKKIQTNVIKTMIIVSALYAVMWLPTYVPMLLYYVPFSNSGRPVVVSYIVIISEEWFVLELPTSCAMLATARPSC